MAAQLSSAEMLLLLLLQLLLLIASDAFDKKRAYLSKSMPEAMLAERAHELPIDA